MKDVMAESGTDVTQSRRYSIAETVYSIHAVSSDKNVSVRTAVFVKKNIACQETFSIDASFRECYNYKGKRKDSVLRQMVWISGQNCFETFVTVRCRPKPR